MKLIFILYILLIESSHASEMKILAKAKHVSDPFLCARIAIDKAILNNKIPKKNYQVSGNSLIFRYKRLFQFFTYEGERNAFKTNLVSSHYNLVAKPFWYPLEGTAIYIPLDGDLGVDLAGFTFQIERDQVTHHAKRFSCSLVSIHL